MGKHQTRLTCSLESGDQLREERDQIMQVRFVFYLCTIFCRAQIANNTSRFLKIDRF